MTKKGRMRPFLFLQPYDGQLNIEWRHRGFVGRDFR